MRVAIVGSGVAGLVCAHRLRRDHSITLFEADARIGGHVHTVDVELDGAPYAVDTGFIVYNEQNYPGFTRLLAELGVATRPSDMSFSVSCERSGIEWGSRGLGSLLADPRNLGRPRFLRMLRDLRRFFGEAPELLASEAPKLSLADWLGSGGYSRDFVDLYLIPMGAAIWSADPERFLRFPARAFVRFFANHGLLAARGAPPWRVVAGGSRSYVEALVEPFRHRVRTATPVRRIRRTADGVELRTDADVEHFDRVVLAVHSDQALAMLDDANDLERSVLGAIRYQENDAVLHTDASLMPRHVRAWSSWNYRVPANAGEVPSRALVTYDMKRLQGLRASEQLLVTLNATERIDPSRVVAKIAYHHPIFDTDAMAAQQLHAEIDGRGGVHFAGAYWGWGFHEDGLQSAIAVCERIGARR